VSALPLTPFDHQPRTRVVFGPDGADRVGDWARELGGQRALLVTDAGLVQAGHAARVEAALRAAGLAVITHDRVQENPTTCDVESSVAIARTSAIDLIVGLGGGSAMDTAKGCNFLLTNGGQMRDYWGVGKATRPMLPLIAIPTTAGTGSECQSAALIADADTHQKMACLDPKAAPRLAVLDPVLTLSQPPRVTACTGLDAIAHAVESAVTTKRTGWSRMYSREAWRLCLAGFERVLRAPQDLDARGQMLLGSALAGAAIENSMLGAAHAAANPLTAQRGMVHGQAVALMLPHVVAFNCTAPAALEEYANLAVMAGLANGTDSPEARAGALVQELRRLLDLAGMPRSLSECGVTEGMIPALAEAAASQWTAGFNPRRVDRGDFIRLYQAALES
jgi:alcohol dehydrogenase